jgi:hypothetical protein
VVSGLAFTVRSAGFALNEVVVALLERPAAARALARFAVGLAIVSSSVLAVVAATPLAGAYFTGVSALPAELLALAGLGAWLVVPLPAITVLQSLYQGALVHHRRTAAITVSVLVFLLVSVTILTIGVVTQAWTGLYVGLVALVVGNASQLFWLWRQGRRAYDGSGARPVESFPLSDPPTS